MRATVAVLACLAGIPPALACTTFCVRGAEGLVYGRNYDYYFGDGMAFVNARGVEKISLLESNPARWVSKHGSLTFNQYGKDSPAGGVNERGLVVELMELPEAKYPAPDSRPAVGALEWVQYQLDNFASVEEVLQGAKRIRIGTRAPLHFLIADRGGDSAAIEFLNGRMIVRRGESLPDRVLANSTYDDSREYAASGKAIEGELPLGQLGSLERFTRAARLVKAAEATPGLDAVGRSFEILEAVTQKGHTQWQVVYDLSRSTVHFRTTSNPRRRSVDVSKLDFSCASGGAMFDIDAGQGDVTAAFLPYAPEANERLMLTAFDKSPHFRQPPPAVRAEAARIETRRCLATG